MPRWLLVGFGFALAAAAGYALLTADPTRLSRPTDASHPGAQVVESVRPGTDAPAKAPAHRRIDERSRRELEAILRRADQEGDGG